VPQAKSETVTVVHEMQYQAAQKLEYQRKGRLNNKPQRTSENLGVVYVSDFSYR